MLASRAGLGGWRSSSESECAMAPPADSTADAAARFSKCWWLVYGLPALLKPVCCSYDHDQAGRWCACTLGRLFVSSRSIQSETLQKLTQAVHR